MSLRVKGNFPSEFTVQGVTESHAKKLRYNYANELSNSMASNFGQTLKQHIRSKRFLWNNRNSENDKSTESPRSVLTTVKTINTESTRAPRSWRSWFSDAVGKAKKTYAKAVEGIKSKTIQVKKRLKKFGKDIAKKFSKVRNYFVRSDDKFNVFANKVKERVENRDENAIHLLHKLGIDVHFDKEGHVIGSEVNKTSLPVNDILIKEGLYFEHNKTILEKSENNSFTSFINLNASSLKPILTSYSISSLEDITGDNFSEKISIKADTDINTSPNFLHSTPHPPKFFSTVPSILESKFTTTNEPSKSASMRYSVKFSDSFSLTNQTNSSERSTEATTSFISTTPISTRLINTFSKIFEFTNDMSLKSSNEYNSELPHNINSGTTSKLLLSSESMRIQNGFISTHLSPKPVTINQTINLLNFSSSLVNSPSEYSLTNPQPTKILAISSTNVFKSTKNSILTSKQMASYTEKSTEKSTITSTLINKLSSQSTKKSELISSRLNSFSKEPTQKSSVTLPSNSTNSETYSKTSLDLILNTTIDETFYRSTKSFYNSSFTNRNLITAKSSSDHIYPTVTHDRLSETPIINPNTERAKTVNFSFTNSRNPKSYDSSPTTTKPNLISQTRKEPSSSSFSTSEISKALTTSTAFKVPTEPPPFPDIFGESNVRERLHEVFMNGDFNHEDLKTTFDFDPALYENFYYEYYV